MTTDRTQERAYDQLSLADKARQWAKAYEVTGQSVTSRKLVAFLREVAITLDHYASKEPMAGNVRCSVLTGADRDAAEKACSVPWTETDGVPYCDLCGLFRASVRLRREP